MKTVALLCSLSVVASAYGVNFPELSPNFPSANSQVSSNFADYNFDGIVALSNCSGSLVRFDDAKNTDMAMVLSNGHCVSLLDPGVVIINTPSTKTFTVLSKSATKLGTVKAQKIIYATMTNTDASLFLLTESYQDIFTKYGASPLTMARTAPTDNTGIEVISGYWKRGYSCQIELTVPTLKEGNWTFTNSLRYSRPGCEVIGGTSGSPVIAAGTRTVIAVNNTVNESGLRCELNNPCEVAADGSVFYKKGYAYAQQTYEFYTCRDTTGQFSLNVEGCLLPKPQ